MAQTDIARGSQTQSGGRDSAAGSILYDPKVRGLFFQIALLVLLALFFAWIISNTVHNLAEQDKKSGFAFLGQTSGFQILTTPGTWITDFHVGASTYLDVFWLGVVNTLVVSVLGIAAATLLGFVLGVFRLSSNIVLRGFSTVYIEVLRNIPLLLQLFVWYKVVVELLPDKRAEDPLTFPGGFLLDKSGLWGAYPLPQDGFMVTVAAVAVAIIFWIVLSRWSAARMERTGQPFPVFWVGLAALIIIPTVVFYATGAPLLWEEPERGRFGFKNGVGMVIKPEMFAVWMALTLYTAAFIAEIVRAGILAVSKGQSEAAFALGLRQQRTLSLVIIPQALRVIIPPLTSQFLNLMKNSSLAVAIAYPDVVSVFAGTALNQVGQEIEMIFMMMMVYLFFSISISLFMNWYNKRMALVER